MKKLNAAIIAVTTLLTLNSAMAIDVVSDGSGKTKIGVVSASEANSLDSLMATLSNKAREQGTTSMKILSAGGKNKMYGVAEIYQ